MANSSLQKNGADALAASIKGLRTSRKKLERVIARKKIKSKNYDSEMYEKARITSRLPHLQTRLAFVEAGKAVIAAPTVAEIHAVKALIKKVEAIATAQAATKQGFKVIQSLTEASSGLGAGVKVKQT